jgi:hypothetical protein
VLTFQDRKENNIYIASYKLKVISFAEQFGNRAAQREFGNLESNVCYWREQKELLKNAKSDSRAFRGPKAGKSAYFTHPDFTAAKLEKKCANYASKYGNQGELRYLGQHCGQCHVHDLQVTAFSLSLLAPSLFQTYSFLSPSPLCFCYPARAKDDSLF